MSIIITYDIPEKHVEFKRAMTGLGYLDRITHAGKVIYLPNTTLYHTVKTADSAVDDAKHLCSQLNIKLERCVASIWSNWAAIYGESFN